MSQRVIQIKKAIEDSEYSGLKGKLDFLTGYSGEKLVGTLQRMAAAINPDEVYCEIGVFQGLTLVSVAHTNPSVTCIGIDNFAFFDPKLENKSILENRIKLAGCKNISLIESDFEKATKSLEQVLMGRRIGVFFIDGPHDYRSQLLCFLFYEKYFSDEAVIVIDDCNYAHVRQANNDFLLSHEDYALLFEKYTYKHPNNMTQSELIESKKGWWNGVNIIVADKKNIVPRKLPPTESSRDLFQNEHIVHSMRYANLAQDSLRFARSLYPLNIKSAIKEYKRLIRLMKASSDQSLLFDETNMRGL
jgi:hypothetical protein